MGGKWEVVVFTYKKIWAEEEGSIKVKYDKVDRNKEKKGRRNQRINSSAVWAFRWEEITKKEG